MMRRAIVSVHDVMPATLGGVNRILSLLDEARIPPPTLLVVPGKDWTPDALEVLREFAERGHPLAGHGWTHKSVYGSRTLYHRLHGLLISRNEAEHLSRAPEEIAERVRKCYDWFPSVDLPAPELYVPPTWALGALSPNTLKSLPFRWYEVLRGFIDARTGKARWLPLVGFEADTTFRKVGVRFWNTLNTAVANGMRDPLRISIHPGDLDLFLGDDLKKMVQNPWRFIRESEVMVPPAKGGGS